MTDSDRMQRLLRAAVAVTGEIEETVGEMSRLQRVEVIGCILGFWCAEEEVDHPRADGRRWKDVISGKRKAK